MTNSDTSAGDTERSVVWQYGPAEQQHIRDANRADGRPDGLTFDVEGGEVTATGSAESIRWLYDYLHYLKRAWRNEGEQWDADTAEEMAESLYEQVDGDLPERQRNKKVMTDGGRCAGDTDRGTVYVAGRQASGGPERSIHTNRACPILDKANTVYEKDRSMFPDDKPVCAVCGGEIERPETHDTSHLKSLKAAAEADSE